MKQRVLLKILLCSVCLSGCGAITTTSVSSFKLRIVGVYSVPVGASGTDAPRSHTYLFKSLALKQSDGTAVSLYADTAKTFKVIDRPQMMFANYDMSAYDGLAFSQATVELDPSVVVATKTDQEAIVTLGSGSLVLDEAFKISKAQSQTLTIKVSWGKTVTEVDGGTDTVSLPTFAMIYAND